MNKNSKNLGHALIDLLNFRTKENYLEEKRKKKERKKKERKKKERRKKERKKERKILA